MAFPIEGRARRRHGRRTLAGALIAVCLGLLALQGALASEEREPPEAEEAADANAGDEADEPASAAESERGDRRDELQALIRDIAVSDERQDELQAEIDAIEKNDETLTRRAMETAARIQDLEESLTATEARLERLGRNEADVRESLAGREAVLMEVLAAAQRIGRRPPPALVVRPSDALEAVRSAIVLGAVLPEIRIEASALASELESFVRLRQRAEEERGRLVADARSHAEEQERLDLLAEEQRALRARSETELATERARAGELAERAATLEELIADLETEIAAARDAAAAAADADARAALDAQDDRPRIDDASRLSPAIAFAAATGRLPKPVRGVAVTGFGQDDGFGGRTEGLSIATRAGARVTAPSDGWVVYAGPYRSYGELLILNAGDGYHVVLAGMDRIDVEIGQFVLTGEPVGAMGEQRVASAAVADISLSQPVLYVEFRKDGAAIDPAPWWSGSDDRKGDG